MGAVVVAAAVDTYSTDRDDSDIDYNINKRINRFISNAF